MEEELRVRKIRNGTVIDHITAGLALDVLSLLGVTGKEGYTVSIVLNVSSQNLGKKDIVKIEERRLDPREVDMIAILSPMTGSPGASHGPICGRSTKGKCTGIVSHTASGSFMIISIMASRWAISEMLLFEVSQNDTKQWPKVSAADWP